VIRLPASNPHPTGGFHSYDLEADSSLKAAAIALRLHTKPVAHDVVITVIPEGVSALLWNVPQINAQAPSYRHRPARVSQWMRNAEWIWTLALFAFARVAPIDRPSASTPAS
jgi:hypothetical protein